MNARSCGMIANETAIYPSPKELIKTTVDHRKAFNALKK